MKTTKEAAEILGVSPRRIVALLSEGVLAGERVGKMWLVDEASIARRLERASNAGRPRLGSAACQTRFVLKNRTHSIMELVYDSDIREFTWAGPLIDSERAPLGLAMERDRITLPSFNVWWKNRGIPEGRAGVERLLEEAGVSVPSELAVRSLGLSLSDQYWLQPEGSDIEWRDVNFFMNDFEDVRGRGIARGILTTPRTAIFPSIGSLGQMARGFFSKAAFMLIRNRITRWLPRHCIVELCLAGPMWRIGLSIWMMGLPQRVQPLCETMRSMCRRCTKSWESRKWRMRCRT